MPGTKRFQGLGHVHRRGGPLGGILGQHPFQQCGQLLVYVGGQFPDCRCRRLHVGRHLVERPAEGRALERRAAGKQLEERAAEAVDVCPIVRAAAVGGLFGGHVVGRAHGLAGPGHFVAAAVLAVEAGKPQVEDLDLAPRREHEVGGLDVAVDQVVLVDVLKTHGNLPGEFAGVRHAEPAGMRDQPRQVQPLDILHDQHRAAVDFAGVVGADDLRVVQPADGLHLAFEACDGPLVLDVALGQHLDRDNPVELGVQGLVDGAHAAVPELLEELVFAKLAGDGKRHHGGARRVRWSAAHRLGAGQGDAALGLGQERIVRDRSAEPGNQRVVVFMQRRERCLAGRTGVEVRGQDVRGVVGEPSHGVVEECFAAGTIGGHLGKRLTQASKKRVRPLPACLAGESVLLARWRSQYLLVTPASSPGR